MFCLNCHKEFDKNIVGTGYEHGEAWGAPYTISYACCPFCGDYEIIDNNEYHHCDNCGEVCEEYIATEDGRYYCENCYTVKHLN